MKPNPNCPGLSPTTPTSYTKLLLGHFYHCALKSDIVNSNFKS